MGTSGCAFPPWTGVVEARDEDGIVSHQEEQLNPNRSSVPRTTGRRVAQLMMLPRQPVTHVSRSTPARAVAQEKRSLYASGRDLAF